MASTRTKNLARAIQRANPDMKYTEALRHAEAGRFVWDPKGPTEPLLDMMRAVGHDATPVSLFGPDQPGAALDPLQFHGSDNSSTSLTRGHLDLDPALWDGGVHPDPLTFLVGHRLDTGEPMHLTLGEMGEHILTTGGTASGKTSLVEIIAAQNLVRPMPWDSSLHGTVVIVDPKGPFARRWAGRPGVVAANGVMDAAEPDENGDPVKGYAVMLSAMRWVRDEWNRRTSVVSGQSPLVGAWTSLPDEVKRRERFAPMFVVLDEYLDFTDGNDDPECEEALQEIARLTHWIVRKGRMVGIHVAVVAREVKASTMGADLLRGLRVRAVTGQMRDSQLRVMFGDREDIPAIEATRRRTVAGEERATVIPGRARIMVTPLMGTDPEPEITSIQVPWFGGRANADALDKWLPRGEVPPNGDFSLPCGKPRQMG